VLFKKIGIFGLFCSTFGICQPKLVGSLQRAVVEHFALADVIAMWGFMILMCKFCQWHSFVQIVYCNCVTAAH